MAIQATVIRGGITIQNAYIMVSMARIEKYLRPTLDDQGNFAGNVVATMATARVSIYASEAERQNNFGQNDFNYTITFDHTPGQDPVAEAYNWIKANGIPGWGISENMVDV